MFLFVSFFQFDVTAVALMMGYRPAKMDWNRNELNSFYSELMLKLNSVRRVLSDNVC